MRIEKPNLRELLDLKKLGYFDIKLTQYVEYDPIYLPRLANGDKKALRGFLAYADIFEGYRITPLSFANLVCYEPSKPDDFKNHKPYALAIFKNNEEPSKFFKGDYHCRATIKNSNEICLTDAVAITTYDGDAIKNEDIYRIADLYGKKPVVLNHGDLMDYLMGRKK